MDPMVWSVEDEISLCGLLKNRYGSIELSRQVGPNLLRGLAGSVLLHLLALAALFATVIWNGADQGRRATELSGPITLIPPWHPVRPLPPIVPELTRPAPPDVLKNPVPVPFEPDVLTTPDPIVKTFGLPGEAPQKGTGYTGDPPLNVENGQGVFGDEPILEPHFIPREVEPAPLTTNPQPEYPVMARISGVRGTVVMWVYVDKRGDVREWRLVKVDPVDLGFEQEVEKVIPKWKFAPALQQNQPVGVWVSIPFKFSIRK